MPEHSPEPWVRSPYHKNFEEFTAVSTGDDGQETLVADFSVSGHLPEEVMLANLNRANACVNACLGLNPELVPELVGMVEKLLCGLFDAGAHAAKLANAGGYFTSAVPDSEKLVVEARELLAKVKA